MASTINSSTSNGIVITPDTSGEIELQANGVTKAKITANGLQDANGASLRGGMYRNLIINGDMKIAQRGTSATGLGDGSAGLHTVDRWRFAEGGTPTFVWTMSQDTDIPTGQGFSNSLKWQCTTAEATLASTSVFYMRHKIEGQNCQHLKFGTANAESVTLSFWTKSNKTGTYIAEFFQNDAGRFISRAYTIDTANTWEKKTITIPGDISGQIDNDNGTGFELFFWYAAGTDYSSGTLNTSWSAVSDADRGVGQVNLADSTSNYINITGVQLEVGSGASDFEFLPYDVQLARCQRYYRKYQGTISGLIGSCYDTSYAYARLQTDAWNNMRATPTYSMNTSTSDWDFYSAGAKRTLTSVSINIAQQGNIQLRFLSSGGFSSGSAAHIDSVGNPNLQFNAEL